ncbi:MULTISPECIES: flagellin [Leptospirillum]|jgi:flagellin|uniref:Flagellin n=3 Tax=Leptospirillum ferriphilum TaxID=178606 RepID=A0A059XRI5_9BACT|nr:MULTISPECIES: flagellin [Leptospirillum]EAY58228.1 MAG: putative flagellin [Leptospirillum rubarum]EIJ76463.1 MAG: Putative flagellin [Leptospirillum sp. Group II 'C75']AFS54495.1 flagellin [Leptospirillum ferriphilum ML-04]AIA31189.1 flagellin [Leptospirillum ferriphilum YSK]AKS24410.1 flagellin [Leptospirillum sp. Group II 'CF-1']
MSGLVINTNTASLGAQYNLNATQDRLNRSINRLSSGYRVNTPADDPAGYAIGQVMNSYVKSVQQAIRNAHDGAGLIQTTNGALLTDNDILVKMRQLAIQAANSTYAPEDLSVLQNEYQHLMSEINRIALVTNFNGRKVLDGSMMNGMVFQIDSGTDDTNRLVVSIPSISTDVLGIYQNSVLVMSLGATSIMNESMAISAISAIDGAMAELNTIQGTLGAFQERMTWTIRNLNTALVNVQASKSQIKDVNFASETANFVKNRILQQSSTAVLSQANQIPQAAVKLIP